MEDRLLLRASEFAEAIGVSRSRTYIVVGRPIRDAADPCAAAEAIQSEIALAFR
jgi:orotidine-5'-phosphate decarboxylase